jgi:thiamine pyrophosphate-dependent acetolactate synthase large subunit-like protein
LQKNKIPSPETKPPIKKQENKPQKSYQLQECKAAATSLDRHKNPGSLLGGGVELGTNTHRL